MNSLENAKVGDKVIYNGGFGGEAIHTISSVTDTQVRVAFTNALGAAHEVKFRKTDGNQIGKGTWDTSNIRIATEEDFQRIEIRAKIKAGRARLKAVADGPLSLSMIEAMLKAYDEIAEKKISKGN